MTQTPPPVGRGSQRGWNDWPGIAALLEKNSGAWVLVSEGVTSGLVQKVRKGGIPALADLGGRLEIVERNTRYDPEHPKTRRGDLYLKWTPASST